METFDAIYQRRAVKHYDPSHELTDEEINRLMEAAIQAPTSFNLPNDHVVSFMIAVGKAAKPAWPKPGQLPLEEVVVHNRFA
jgi:nitroreductase